MPTINIHSNYLISKVFDRFSLEKNKNFEIKTIFDQKTFEKLCAQVNNEDNLDAS